MVNMESTRSGYAQNFDRAAILTDKAKGANKHANTIRINKGTYQDIQRRTAAAGQTKGVPWFVVGVLHMRESNYDFDTHLHNGNSLNARTVDEPAGRPATGSPPFTFIDSAVDALTMKGLHKVKRYSVERTCYQVEGYNGFGVMLYHANHLTGYLWAWTQLYTGGKYGSDNHWTESLWDKQPGCIAVLKALAEQDKEVAAWMLDREANPPQDVLDDSTKTERAGRKAGGAAAGGGAASEVVGTVQPDIPVKLPLWVNATVICFGVALIVLASILIRKKVAAIRSKWSLVP